MARPVSYLPDLTGQVFGHWLVLSQDKSKRRYWHCQCVCGVIRSVRHNVLITDESKSCGCMNPTSTRFKSRHGMSRTKTYKVWASIISRCTDINNHASHRYMKRGIGVAEEWLIFENFLSDMGEQPEGLQIDRINNDLGYSKENCRWVTSKINNNNTSRNRYCTYLGETLSIKQWSEKRGVKYTTLLHRINNGYSIEDALNFKVKERGTLIEYNQEYKSMKEWSRTLGIKRTTLFARLNVQNLTVSEAFTKPLPKFRAGV